MKSLLMVFCFSILVSSIWPLITLLVSPFLLLATAFLSSKYLNLALVFLVGSSWVFWHWQDVNNNALTVEQGRQSWQLTGEIGRVSHQKNRTEFDYLPNGPFQKLKISCYHCPWNFERGDRWALAVKLKPFTSFYNPVSFNYREWMLAKGYEAYGSVDLKHLYNYKINSDNYTLPKQINITLSEGGFPILRALLLGDKKTLPADFRRVINGSGLGHLFVISGLHIGMMALVVSLFFMWLQRMLLLGNWFYGPLISVLAGYIAAVFYAYLSGFNTPVVRACIMLLFAMLMLFRQQNTSIVNYLVMAFMVVILINPLAFMELGSWLSFVIVGCLIFGLGVGRSKIRQLFAAQYVAFFSSGVVLLLAGMAVAPFGFLLNLFFIPFITILVLPVAVVSLVLSLLNYNGLLVLLEQSLAWVLEGLIEFYKIVTWSPQIHSDNKIIILCALVLWLLPGALRFRWLGIVVIVVGLLVPVQRPSEGGFKLTVLDVGQGSAALIETSHHSVLVDTGTRFMSGMSMADYVVLPFLRLRGINQLNILHITHGDIDHSGGQGQLEGISLSVIDQKSCESFSWVWDGVVFERFKALGFDEGNDGSCLLKVTDSIGRSVLMTGDVEKKAELALLGQGAPLKAELLLVPHHGSKTSSSAPFLNAVAAEMAIISAGVMNHYGHPHSEIVQRLNNKSIEVYSTASHGAIQVDFDPRQEALSVSTYRPIFK